MFSLHTYLILIFRDIPAVSMVMRMTGHNGYAPCCMCKITGVRILGAAGTTHYVPVDHTNYPDILYQGQHSETAPTDAEANCCSRSSGIKVVSVLFNLGSIRFPLSFPYDFMHLIWENLIKNLVLHWTSKFKGMDAGSENYVLEKEVWKAIGEATALPGATIPSTYGVVPNLAADGTYMSAEMYSFWTLYLGPILLRRQFSSECYYTHFIGLV
ncbi:hypothetical protein F5876DRAFT_91689 [Lentinula aff. lateritia]|uniref:Uncharacterized protein n=1 Tax=Lentinula aff. lateritia TaxID=2804960 RepID=A0ACC1TJZ9_9AGAR|nr:hypothetical protein F5876DRAFT_91689 [Lentinula aff. lateritia]